MNHMLKAAKSSPTMRNLWCGPKLLKSKYNCHRNVLVYHRPLELNEEVPSPEWYETAYPKLLKLTHALQNVDLINGRLINFKDYSIIVDDHINHEIQKFRSLARAFIGAPWMQQALKKEVSNEVSSKAKSVVNVCFSNQKERMPITLNSLTRVCDFLNVSAQQRKSLRLTISPQVTQQHIWRGVIVEQLKDLKSEMDVFSRHSAIAGLQMGDQIVSNCMRFLANTTNSFAPDSPSWMRLAPTKKVDSPPSYKWGDILEMFDDLIKCFGYEKRLANHMSKLKTMREGLYQIKEVLLDRDIGYREARHQEFLLQKKLKASLGHSSQCLFRLLLYYLHGSVDDIEIEVSGGIYGSGGRFCLYMGKILTSDEDRMVRSGVKQLGRALGLFKFVWETAGMKGVLELQGHLWCVGAEEKILRYRGNVFFIHGIRLW